MLVGIFISREILKELSGLLKQNKINNEYQKLMISDQLSSNMT